VPATGTITYFIAAGDPAAAYRDGDPELARWALAAWQRAAAGGFELVEVENAADAAIRVVFAGARGGTFGVMSPSRTAAGIASATVVIYPDTDAFGAVIAERARSDPLYRDTIVYLTCVHEIGHALGLEHTADFADIMYWFAYGGDIPGFFGRYRDRLRTRADIARYSGLSPGDVTQLRGSSDTAPRAPTTPSPN
jgi:predicted Zn-dependent protease